MGSADLLSSVSIMEVGTTFSTFLFGISTLQAYSYYLQFHQDRRSLKLLAFSIWALELGHAIAILHFFYTLSILQYGQDDFLQHKAPASLPVAALFDGILSFLVSGFFIRRVIKLTNNKLIASLCICLTTLRIMGLISLSVLGTLDTEVEFLEKRKWLVITSATIGAVGDVLIAGTLVHNLYHRKRDYFDSSENPRTLKMLDQLIVETLRTGLINSVISMALAICLLTMTQSLVWVAIFVCQARAYTNSFFGTLNSRVGLRSSASSTNALDLPKHSDLRFATAGTKPDASNLHAAHLTFVLTTAPGGTIAGSESVRRSRAYTIHTARSSYAGSSN